MDEAEEGEVVLSHPHALQHSAGHGEAMGASGRDLTGAAAARDGHPPRPRLPPASPSHPKVPRSAPAKRCPPKPRQPHASSRQLPDVIDPGPPVLKFPKGSAHPPLPPPSAYPIVPCRQCGVLLRVPSELPPPKRGKHKLRCGVCDKISKYLAPPVVQATAISVPIAHEPHGGLLASFSNFQDKLKRSGRMLMASELPERSIPPPKITSLRGMERTSDESHKGHSLKNSTLAAGSTGSMERTSDEVHKDAHVKTHQQANVIDAPGSGVGSSESDLEKVVEGDDGLKESIAPAGEEEDEDLNSTRSLSLTESGGDASGTMPVPLRSDVVALGFEKFDDQFDPKRILCIYGTVDGGFVEIFFFHVEGMATFFGVGLPFAQILLGPNCVVVVKELQEPVWTEHWMESKMQLYSLVLFDATNFSTEVPPTANLRIKQLATDQETEHRHDELEGSDHQQDASRDTARPPAWIIQLQQFLTSSPQHLHDEGVGKENSTPDVQVSEQSEVLDPKTIPGNSGSGVPGQPEKPNAKRDPGHGSLRNHPGAPNSKLNQGNSDGQSEIHHETSTQNGHSPVRLERQEDLQALKLTVSVYLDSQSTIQSSGDIGSDRSRSSHDGRLDGTSGDPTLNDFQMVPKVTVKFLCIPNSQGDYTKKIETTLDVSFLAQGSLKPPEFFGWYHDQLQLSFACQRPSAVSLDTRESDLEILSNHESRTADLGRHGAKESSSSTATCLVGANYSIARAHDSADLSYLATIFPPLHCLDLWDSADRKLAYASGVMSSVPIKVEGYWTLRELDDENSAAPATEGCGFCAYEFSCQRDLTRQQRVEVEKPSKGTRKFFPSFQSRKHEICIEKSTLQQKLSRSFLLDHSFSHILRPQIPHPQIRSTAGTCEAPRPISGGPSLTAN